MLSTKGFSDPKDMVILFVDLTKEDLIEIDNLVLKYNLRSREEAIEKVFDFVKEAYMQYIADRN